MMVMLRLRLLVSRTGRLTGDEPIKTEEETTQCELAHIARRNEALVQQLHPSSQEAPMSEQLLFAAFASRNRAMSFATAIAVVLLAPPAAKAQTPSDLTEIVTPDIRASGVAAPQPALRPHSITVTGDGQMGPGIDPGASENRPQLSTDGRARELDQDLEVIAEPDDAVVNARP
jgi:hypothetical protein